LWQIQSYGPTQLLHNKVQKNTLQTCRLAHLPQPQSRWIKDEETERRKDTKTLRKKPVLRLHVLFKLALNVTCCLVFADMVFGFPKAGIEDTIAISVSASKLGRSFPDYLREMRCLRIIGIVVRRFILPALNSLRNIKTSCTSRQVFSEWTKCSAGVLENTFVSPFLSFIS
jgi:hypothetical protein